MRALGDLDDAAFRAAARVVAGALDQRAVAVHHLLHLARRQEHVRAAGIGNQETEAVAMTLHPAGGEVELARQQQHPLAVGQQLSVALHRQQAPVQVVEVGRGHREPFGQLDRGHRHVGRAQALENRLARRGKPGRRGQASGHGLTGNLTNGAGRLNCPALLAAGIDRPPPAELVRQAHRPDGGIGRRTRFRSWRWQHCGGSSPLLGTMILRPAQAGLFVSSRWFSPSAPSGLPGAGGRIPRTAGESRDWSAGVR